MGDIFKSIRIKLKYFEEGKTRVCYLSPRYTNRQRGDEVLTGICSKTLYLFGLPESISLIKKYGLAFTKILNKIEYFL